MFLGLLRNLRSSEALYFLVLGYPIQYQLGWGQKGLFSTHLSMLICCVTLILNGAVSVYWPKIHSEYEYFRYTFYFAACQIGLVVAHSIWLTPMWLEPLNVWVYASFLCLRMRSFRKKEQVLHGIAMTSVALCTVRYIVNHQLLTGESAVLHGAILAGLMALGISGFLLSDDTTMSVWYMVGAAAGAFLFSEGVGSLIEVVFCNLVWFQICFMHVWTICSWFWRAQVRE